MPFTPLTAKRVISVLSGFKVGDLKDIPDDAETAAKAIAR